MMRSSGPAAAGDSTTDKRMSQPPRLLAIDCATLPASLALVSREGTVSEVVHGDERRSDAWINAAIDDCLRGSGLGVADVEGFAVSVGPGTFTGIRVGIATALGLAAPHGRPVAGVRTLDALACIGRRHAEMVAACIDARRGQVYAAIYGARTNADAIPLAPAWGPAVCSPEEFARALDEHGDAPLIIGSGAPLLPEGGAFPVHVSPVPLAAAIGELALRAWPPGDAAPHHWPPPEPVYLRPPDATPPRNPLLAQSG